MSYSLDIDQISLVDPGANFGERPLQAIDLNPLRTRDVMGRLKTSRHQNIYEADFEYGPQPLRWESFTAGAASIVHLPGEGGVRLRLTTAGGDIAIRQSRPYMRYQPGKTMFMASAMLFGLPLPNQVNRVGFFDDSNGAFFEQAGASPGNPAGMAVVVRSDAGGVPVDTRFQIGAWNGEPRAISALDWGRIQMLWVEYAWYGAGAVRFGVMLDGQPHVLHQVGYGNRVSQVRAWARTGNLPVRYEQRNLGVTTAQNDMIHYGVSVMVEGGVDDQRGFTYSYGMAASTPRRNVAQNSTRFPVLSIRGRVMGTQETTQAGGAISSGTTTAMTVAGTPWAVNQWAGRFVAYGAAGATPSVARIISNTANALTIADPITGGAMGVAPAAGNNYTIGLVNRGQILPRLLLISSDALCVVEIIASTPTSAVSLTGSNFVPLASLGSANSFAERDVSATALSGGEVVMAFTAPAGGSGLLQIELEQLFPLLTTVRGNAPDILTVAVTTQAAVAANVGAHLICQEAMS